MYGMIAREHRQSQRCTQPAAPTQIWRPRYAHASAGASCSVGERQSGQVDGLVGTFLPSLLFSGFERASAPAQGLSLPGLLGRQAPTCLPGYLPQEPTYNLELTCCSAVLRASEQCGCISPSWKTTLSRPPHSRLGQLPDLSGLCLSADGYRLRAAGWWSDVIRPGLQSGLKLPSWVWVPKHHSRLASYHSATQRARPGAATNRRDQISSGGLSRVSVRASSPATNVYPCNLF